ncbi:hypothetical protein ASE74_15745 [Pedobacter sp. Leaf216]|uniref:hypothetical protein n=1 Tax=Pedobacter sp. Leaf216 TaxID=1735684 RepID=UPI0006F6E914|nr:hypothetical protein [Pedobacter sp. Leaf216]KQM77853.1 hypothetical protein ASE74_15745 [Pedobacter sp. Leaf216]
MEKLLLSETAKQFMDYAVDTLAAMDGAPEHDEDKKAEIKMRFAKLREYLNVVEQSYIENTPADAEPQVDPAYIAEVGHS